MAYIPTTPQLGIPGMGTISAAVAAGSLPSPAAGTICKFFDPTFGEGEFIYLPGCAATLVGSLVTYDPVALTTTLAPNTANLDTPVAVAMAANVGTTTWAWYQISGAAVLKKISTPVSNSKPVFLSSTIGRVTGVAANGKQVLNCVAATAGSVISTISTVTVILSRPFLQGQTV